jgi:hypothetical protein
MKKTIVFAGFGLIVFGLVCLWESSHIQNTVDAYVDVPVEDIAEWHASETFKEDDYDNVVVEYEDEDGYVHYATYKDGKCVNMWMFDKHYYEYLYSVDD